MRIAHSLRFLVAASAAAAFQAQHVDSRIAPAAAAAQIQTMEGTLPSMPAAAAAAMPTHAPEENNAALLHHLVVPTSK